MIRSKLFLLTSIIVLASSVTVPSALVADDAEPIRIGLMADFTALPFLVAEREGLFSTKNVAVNFKIFRSAVERDAALQAGALDGCNADVIAAIANMRGGYDIRVVASAYNRFSLIAGPHITAQARRAGRSPSIVDLKNASIGISKNTVIEYIVDSIMSQGGVNEYKKTDVPRIPIRLELLLQGKLQAASLPLPFDELAVVSGCAIVGDSSAAGLEPDVFMFYRKDLDARRELYRALWRAVDEARALIAAHPDEYRDLLSTRLGFAEEQAQAIEFPPFPRYQPLSAAEVEKASRWMLSKGLIDRPISSQDIVAPGILP